MDADSTVKNISDTVASMGFEVDVRKLHDLSCVHTVKCFTMTKLM